MAEGSPTGRNVAGSAVIVSCDGHFGPAMESLREYCPARYREQFDDYASSVKAQRRREAAAYLAASLGKRGETDSGSASTVRRRLRSDLELIRRNRRSTGDQDMAVRLSDMDADGVAAEVVFHGAKNGEPIPFVPGGVDFFYDTASADRHLVAIGQHIYNQALADACSTAPARHIGVAHAPLWNVSSAIKELEWARSVGLRAVNFSAPRPGVSDFDDEEWEPFWSAIEDLDMTLATHAGASDPSASYGGVVGAAVRQLEIDFFNLRGLPRMIFGGVFERHPGLRIVFTEIRAELWARYARELDRVHADTPQTHARAPKRPSEYMSSNVFVGASYLLDNIAAAEVVRDDYANNVMWGRDYPHPEGTWVFREGDEEPATRRALRRAMAGIPHPEAKLMVGATAARVYGVDLNVLGTIAAAINAPPLEELVGLPAT